MFYNNKSSGSGGAGGFSDKVGLNWQISHAWNLIHYALFQHNVEGAIRLINFNHNNLASVWDDAYKADLREVSAKEAFSEMNAHKLGLSPFDIEVETAHNLWSAQVRLMGRKNLLPRQNFEGVIDLPAVEIGEDSSDGGVL